MKNLTLIAAKMLRIAIDSDATANIPNYEGGNGWHPDRLHAEISKNGGIISLICLLLGLFLSLAVWFILGSNYLGALAGFLALLAVIALFRNYFRPSRPNAQLTAPNPFSVRSAGLLLFLSALNWTLDGLHSACVL